MKFSEFNVAVNTSQIDFIVGYKGLQNFRISPSDLVGTFSSLNYITDSGSGTIDLGTQAFSILGTANEIETSGALQTLTIGFPASGVTLPDGSVATTQTIGDNSTKIATTAYVDAAVTAEDLDFSGDTGTGSVDLDSQILNIIGTTNEIETAASGQTLTIGLPDDVSITGELTVLGIGQSSFGGQVTIPLNPVATTDAASKGYVDSQVTAQDLDFTGDSGTGQVDLDSQALSITGGAVITTTALNQNLDIVHDNVSRADTTSTDSPAFGGTFTSVDSVSSSSQGHITAINVKTVTLPTPSDATITLDAGTLLNGGGDFTLNQALNETITFNHDSVSRTDTTSTDAPAFGGTFTSVDSVTSSTEGHITAINLKTVTVPTPTYPTVNNNTITIDAGSNLNGGGSFTLNQNTDDTITVNLDTTITGLTSVTSTTFVGALQGNADTASALAASGNITLTGDTTSTGGPYTYTSGGNVAIATTIADTTVTGKLITGVNLGTAQNIAATDTILEAFGYLQAQITQLPQGLVYNGTWNASTNTPTLTSGSGTTGHFYIVSVAGSTNLDGITDWQVGDWAIFVEAGGTDTWQKIDNTSAITGTGATNKLAKWTGPTTLSTGLVEDDGTTVTIGNSGDLDVTGSADITGDLAWGTSLTDTTNTISITKFVDEADGIVSNDNDTSIPTSAAVKDYVDTQLGGQDTLAEILANGNVTGGTSIEVSANDDITFTDTSQALFGSSNDLQILHNGTYSELKNLTGHLYLRQQAAGSDIEILSDDGTGTGNTVYFRADGGTGQAQLFYYGGIKLNTTSTGVQVTGSNLSVLAGSGATKLQFVQTDGNWKIEAGGGTNQLVIHSESLAADYVTIKGGGVVQLNNYGSGSNTGTATQRLGVDSSGNIIEIPIGGGAVDGSGTANYVTKWSDTDTITDSIIYDNGTNIGIGTASITSGMKLDVQGGDFRVGDDANQGFEAGWSAGGGVVFIQGYNRGTSSFLDMSINNTVRITSGGNVGIGVTSVPYKFTVEGSANDDWISRIYNTNTNGAGLLVRTDATSANDKIALGVYADGGYKMVVSSNGDILFGTTTKGNDFAYFEAASSNRRILNVGSSTTSSIDIVNFRNPNGIIGGINTDGFTTSFSSSSDYRLKENVVEMTNALDRISQLKPSRFNFIGEEKTVDGFLAHEVSNIVPESISGTKDAVDEKGNPVYQGIDQSKLVPLLVGAIQELQKRIEILENK